MDAAAVFQPAIEYAEQGFPLTVKNAYFTEFSVPEMLKYPSTTANYLPHGRAPLAGELMTQPDLANSMRAIAEGGAEVFYRGDIADKLVRYMEENGGLITRRDLTDFAVEWQEPVSVTYRGYRVFGPPPPCQAVQYLETLNIMEGFDVAAMGHNSAATLHRFIEAAKLAQADRAEYAGVDDPPTSGLLSKEFAARRRAEIGAQARPSGGERFTSDKMAGEVLAGDPREWMRSECTTHFSVADASGNAVGVTQSLGAGYGSAVVVPGTGIALNNFLYWMDSDPQSPNAVGPGRKLEMCMSPAQVWDDQGLRFLIGTPGSYGILQTTPQMIMNVIDHGMNIQAAIEAPRVKATAPGTLVDVETRIGEDVLLELTLKGHRLNRLGPWAADVGGRPGHHGRSRERRLHGRRGPAARWVRARLVGDGSGRWSVASGQLPVSLTFSGCGLRIFGAAGQVDEAVAAVYAVQAAAHDDGAVILGAQLGQRFAERVVDCAHELAGLYLLQQFHAGAEVAGDRRRHYFVHIAVAQQVQWRRRSSGSSSSISRCRMTFRTPRAKQSTSWGRARPAPGASV